MSGAVVDVRAEVRALPLRAPFVTALRRITTVEAIEVEVVTDDGGRGCGGAAPTPVITGDTTGGILAAITGPLRDAVCGQDSDDFEDLLRRVADATVGNTSAKAALDIALHDLRARTLGLPLHRLLGAASGVVGTDVTVSVDTPEAMARAAVDRVADGFGTVKLKVGRDPAADVRRVRRVRDALGPDVSIRLDANQGWTPKQAVAVMAELERAEVGIELIEQPVAAHDVAGLAFVTERVATPVLADESVATERDALRIVERRAADLVNVKLMKCGGLRAARRIAAIADSAGIGVLVGGMMEPPVAVAAAVCFAATLPAGLDHDLDPAWWLAEQSPLVRYEKGHVHVA